MKIMITGIGGVGGYIASILCMHYPQVTLIARGERKNALLRDGLRLYSDLLGTHCFHPAVTDTPAAAGVQDVLFVCVKNPSLAEALQALQPCIGAHTILCCIMNGVSYAQIAAQIFPHVPLVETCIYITSAYEADYAIRQRGKYAHLYLGAATDVPHRQVLQILQHNGLKCTATPAIQQEIWCKYILNCAYNVSTAYFKSDVAYIFSSPRRQNEFRLLLQEAAAVGRGLGIDLPFSIEETIYNRVAAQKDKTVTSSLARDIRQGRASELETFSGYIVKTAAALGIPVPYSRKYYTTLQEYCRTGA